MVTDRLFRGLRKLIQTEDTLANAADQAGIDEKTARMYRDSDALPSQDLLGLRDDLRASEPLGLLDLVRLRHVSRSGPQRRDQHPSTGSGQAPGRSTSSLEGFAQKPRYFSGR